MNYHDGYEVRLGDTVTVPVPSGTARARVVMLGDTYAHLEIDEQFVEWVEAERMLDPDSVVVEWIDENPFAHEDPRYAPVGAYLFTSVDAWVERVR